MSSSAPAGVFSNAPTRSPQLVGATLEVFEYLQSRYAKMRFLERTGASSIDDYDVLKFVFSLVNPLQDHSKTCRKLVKRFGSFSGVTAAPFSQLRRIEGVSETGALILKFVEELTVRVLRDQVTLGPLISNYDTLLDYLRVSLGRKRVQHMVALYLDATNHLIKEEKIGKGDEMRVDFFSREIIRRGLELNSVAVIIAHNSACDNVLPSAHQVERTCQLIMGLSKLGLVLHDRIIIGPRSWFSFRSNDLIREHFPYETPRQLHEVLNASLYGNLPDSGFTVS